jgi:hypothetical protein
MRGAFFGTDGVRHERLRKVPKMSVKATRDKSGFLRNLATNVKGPSVSVVLIAWLAAVVIVSIYDKLTIALGPLSMFMVIYLLIMGNRPN